MSFEENIQSWVTIDNKIKSLNEQLRAFRDQRNNLEENIIMHIKTNNLQNATVKISDGKLNFGVAKQPAAISYKFIKDCLDECLNNNDQVELIMKYIKSQRQVKECDEIKRFYN